MNNEKPGGLMLEYNGAWELEPIGKRYDLTVFLRSLPILFGHDFVLILTDTSAEEIIEFAASRLPEEKPKLAYFDCGSHSIKIGLVPPFIHRVESTALYIRMAGDDAQTLADLSLHYAEPEVCMGLYVYRGNEVLMDVGDAHHYDAQPSIAGSISEDKVKAFCDAAGFKYSRYSTED